MPDDADAGTPDAQTDTASVEDGDSSAGSDAAGSADGDAISGVDAKDADDVSTQLDAPDTMDAAPIDDAADVFVGPDAPDVTVPIDALEPADGGAADVLDADVELLDSNGSEDVPDDAVTVEDLVGNDAVADDLVGLTDAVDDTVAVVDASGADADVSSADGADDAADGTGISCVTGAECPSNLPFCSASAVCVACVWDIQCGDPGATCLAGTCVAPATCKSSKECAKADQVCDAGAGVCVGCVANPDCLGGQVCWHGQCVAPPVACTSSKQCPQGVCSGGYCVACAADVDCPDSQYCDGDVCLLDTCVPGVVSCTDSANALTCADNGSGWVKGSCPVDTACDAGTCKPVVCTPETFGCDGNTAWACSINGTSKISVSCGEGHVCVGGGCPTKVCEPNALTCNGAQLLTCNAYGNVQSASPCPANQGCVAGACVPHVCTPGVAGCQGLTATSCTVSGQWGTTIQDCSVTGQVCLGGACTDAICTTGQATCKDASTLSTCAADQLSWVDSPCGNGFACESGSCKPIVCAPNQLTCAGSVLQTCNAWGTAYASTTDCTGAGSMCVDGSCKPVICAPAAAQCDGTQLATCNGSGTAWVSAPCAAQTICDSGACLPVICSPGATKCVVQDVHTCNALGTGYANTQSCPSTDQVCSGGACLTQICVPGAASCAGLTLSVCTTDGLGYTTFNCNDGDFCTLDACLAQSAGCSHSNNPCTDGNVCTSDGCSAGACQNPPAAGTCDDGSACTTGETCVGGACVAPSGASSVTSIAGTTGAGYQDGPGSSAKLNTPVGITQAPDGTFVFVESTGARIRTLAVDGTVGTLAGAGTAGSKDRVALAATFSSPSAVAVAPDGSVYVADAGNARIRRIAGGMVSTLAGGAVGFADGVGSAAKFSNSLDMVISRGGSLYVADGGGHRIRRVAPSGKVTTIAGTGTGGYVDGPAATAQLNNPCSLALAADGTLYFYDCNNGRIRKLSTGGVVSTLAGSGNGYQDGAGTSALFGKPGAIALVGNTVLFADSPGNRIRAIDPSGTVSTLAGAATLGFVDGAPGTARFSAPRGLVADWSGTAWIADSGNHRIRKMIPANVTCNDGNPCTSDSCGAGTCTFGKLSAATECSDGSLCTGLDACNAAGQCVGSATNCDDGKACTVEACDPYLGSCDIVNRTGVCDDGLACTGADTCAGGICANTASSLLTYAGAATAGTTDDTGTLARFNTTFGVAVDAAGDVWVADYNNNRIRKVNADAQVTTVAGFDANYVDGDVAIARFKTPTRLTFGGDGTLYVSDAGNQRIRKISGSKVTTLAGSGTAGYLDGPSTSAQFNGPNGLVLDGAGVLYVAEFTNRRIRSVAADGTVGTFAGNGLAATTDGPLASASFAGPRGLCRDAANGTMYVADGPGHTLRKIAGGQVSTLAGTAGSFGMVDGQGAAARFNHPYDCQVDANHDIWVVDGYNFRIRRVTPTGFVQTVAGATTPPVSSADPGNQTIVDGALGSATFMHPYGLAMGKKPGTWWIADNGVVRKLTLTAPLCDDGQPCTVDACDAATGLCTHTNAPDAQSCTNGVPCTVSESCQTGVCQGGVPKNCDDSNACTTDVCTAATGVCAYTKLTGTSCTDSNGCTPNDQCNAGVCDASRTNLVNVAGVIGSTLTGTTDAKGSLARFYGAAGVAWDSNGVAFIPDQNNHRIRKIAVDGTVSTLAGAAAGFADGATTAAKFSSPMDIVRQSNGDFLIADWGNNRIRRISGSTVSTVAGFSASGYLDGPVNSALLSAPTSMDVDANGTIYVADGGNRRIRTISSGGTVATLAGSGVSGGVDGATTSASFVRPSCVRVAPNGAVWVVDPEAFTVRRIANGNVVTVAGKHLVSGTTDGTGAAARFTSPRGCALDKSGNLYVADVYAYRIRKVTPAGVVTTVFGANSTPGTGSAQIPADGLGTAGQLDLPLNLSFASDGSLWVADYNAIRKLTFPTKDCADGVACTTDSCDTASGSCVNLAAAETSACDDSNACTAGEKCSGGACTGGSTVTCNDNKSCTADSCEVGLGCVYTPISGPGCCTPDAGTMWGFESNQLSPLTSTGGGGWSTTGYPNSGNYGVYVDSTITSTSYLNLPAKAIPAAGSTSLSLWYLYYDYLNYPYSYGYRTFSVVINGSTVWTASTGISTGSWYNSTIDLTPYAGTTPTIAIVMAVTPGYSNTTYAVRFIVDDILISTSCP